MLQQTSNLEKDFSQRNFKQSSTTDTANIKDKKRRTYRDDNNKVTPEFA